MILYVLLYRDDAGTPGGVAGASEDGEYLRRKIQRRARREPELHFELWKVDLETRDTPELIYDTSMAREELALEEEEQ